MGTTRNAHTSVHKDLNARRMGGDDKDDRWRLGYYLERISRNSGQCMLALASLNIKRGSGQWAQQAASWMRSP